MRQWAEIQGRSRGYIFQNWASLSLLVLLNHFSTTSGTLYLQTSSQGFPPLHTTNKARFLYRNFAISVLQKPCFSALKWTILFKRNLLHQCPL